jgi:hypothetical protein
MQVCEEAMPYEESGMTVELQGCTTRVPGTWGNPAGLNLDTEISSYYCCLEFQKDRPLNLYLSGSAIDTIHSGLFQATGILLE